MARTRGPGNLVAQRPRTEARTDARAHADYAEMIVQDLGGRHQGSYRAIDDGGPASAVELLLRPVALFLLASTAFVIVLALWLWQAGVFGRLQLRMTPPKPVVSSSWLGTRQPRTIAPVDASKDTLSSAPSVPAATPADTAPPDDDAAAATDKDADGDTPG